MCNEVQEVFSSFSSSSSSTATESAAARISHDLTGNGSRDGSRISGSGHHMHDADNDITYPKYDIICHKYIYICVCVYYVYIYISHV